MKLLLKIKTYFMIIFISIIFAVYLFESYLTYNLNLPKVDIAKKNSILDKKNLKYDTRSKNKIYNDLKILNKNITVTVSPSRLNDPGKKVHFFSGISKTKTIDCNENGYYSSYISDRFGFNNPDDQWDKKEIEYVLVGDSFTHGSCVNRPNDISSILRKLSNKPILNLGYKANGPLSMYATLKEYMPKNAKKVLWVYYEGNDLLDLKDELKKNILNQYYIKSDFKQNLMKKQKYIDQQNKKIIQNSINIEDNIIYQAERDSNFKNKILKIVRLNQTKRVISSFLSSNKREEIPINEFKNILISTKKFLSESKSELYFVYLPQFERYKKKINDDDYKKIKSIVEALNIKFIDIHKEVFKNEKDPLNLFPFKMWGHYNENGYKKISETIYTKTTNERY